MSTRAYYHPRGLDIDLADLSRALYDEIASWRGQIDPPPAPPVLTCLGNSEPMYVYRHQSGRYFARHYPNGNSNRHSHRITMMSDEHRRQVDYSQRAAADHGLDTSMELSTGNGTRLDLGIFGTHNIGFEIQRSQLTRAQAKSRATKSYKAGWPTAWITDREKEPDWSGHVPTARLTLRGGWESLPPRNTANVVIGDFKRERDHTRKTGWRYTREPRMVLLDELSYLMPAGEIISVAIGTKGAVSLAFKGAAQVIDSCTYPGASLWDPIPTTPQHKEAAQDISRACSKHPHATYPRCGCGHELWAPQSIARGYCEKCRMIKGHS